MGWICKQCGSENLYESSVCEACLKPARRTYRWTEKKRERAEFEALRMYRQSSAGEKEKPGRRSKISRAIAAILRLGTYVCLVLMVASVILQFSTPRTALRSASNRVHVVAATVSRHIRRNTHSIFLEQSGALGPRLVAGANGIASKARLVQRNVRSTSLNGSDLGSNLSSAAWAAERAADRVFGNIYTSGNRVAGNLTTVGRNVSSARSHAAYEIYRINIPQAGQMLMSRFEKAVSVIQDKIERLV